MLAKRLATATLLVGVVTLAIYFGSLALATLIGIGFLIASYEYFKMCERAGYRVLTWLGLPLIALLYVDALEPEWHIVQIVVLAVSLLPLAVEFARREIDHFLYGWALLALGVVYLGGMGGYVFRLAMLPHGLQLLSFTLMATWAADSGAYLVGMRWGRHKFFPHISPKKTQEGAVGGIIGAGLAFCGLCWIYGYDPLVALVGGLGIGVAAAAGDLAESLMKRELSLKDSGSILAGHGGMFDRLDSTFLTVVFAYFFASLFLRGL